MTASPVVTPTVIALPSVLAAEAGTDVLRLPTDQHVVALTFDAGANADAIPKILAALQAEKLPGTFFLTGAWVKAFPGQARQVGALYPVGNHSSTHPHFTQLSSAVVPRSFGPSTPWDGRAPQVVKARVRLCAG